ncbi:TIGR02679 domain-containing protein [Rhodococcus chondri]|uniref:TIGR02679 domain-containing protein n=1 Tax=Rhodococcus chondri TaxID=3065941 RepID=A0ABU7JZV7_9NOCA|nr:TIGR02679 domain-containing protein [Rhodococcus sp. CC-R104]MEE2035440.1 TIGR02679 domain-containing protein [Rhodococcus sp. CC-R104]
MWADTPELRAVLERVRKRLERNGLQLAGQVTVPVTESTPNLWRLAVAIRGGRVTSAATRVQIPLAELDRWMRSSANGGRSIIAVLESESPLVDRQAAKAADEQALRDGWSQVRAILDTPQHRHRLAFLESQRMSLREFRSGTLRDAARILSALPAAGISPVELAETVTGDTKALTDTAVRRWVLRVLANDCGVPEPVTASERAAVWEQFGVTDAGLSSRVLSLGVRLEGHEVPVKYADAAAGGCVHQSGVEAGAQ